MSKIISGIILALLAIIVLVAVYESIRGANIREGIESADDKGKYCAEHYSQKSIDKVPAACLQYFIPKK